MKPNRWLGAVLLLAAAQQATAQTANTCFPPPISDCGKGAVRGVTDGVEWSAWWVERDFGWARAHWYRAPGATVILPAPGTASTPQGFAAELWRLNLGSTARSCDKVPIDPVALPACNAMFRAAAQTMPPPILYDVGRATAADGTRPGYRLSSTGALVSDGTRHKTGTWCECWRGAVKPGASQYCLVTQTQSYAVCRRESVP